MELSVPIGLAGSGDPDRRAWLAELPGTVTELARRWSLQVGAPFQPGGQTAWVAPARDAAAADLVLKVGWAHPESRHEAAALEMWGGAGAVRCHAAATVGRSRALLLRRCRPGTALGDLVAEPECDPVVAALLRRLWRDPPTGHPFAPLTQMCEQWVAEFEAAWAPTPGGLDPGLAREGAAVFRALPADTATTVVLCTDLHAGNILAAVGEPWLVIDPKPYVGDPTYDVVQHLLNCPRRLQADPLGLTARLADLLDLDAVRLRLWLFARCVLESTGTPSLVAVARALAPGGRSQRWVTSR